MIFLISTTSFIDTAIQIEIKHKKFQLTPRKNSHTKTLENRILKFLVGTMT